ncbi:MAG: T9SS type A sorting domain-containing protein, partial [bacterium]|nr:T9SS type A sorting domain-containing protein [bacterium]
DPELQTYLCPPGALTVSYPESLTQGTTLIHVNVQSDGMPVDNAVVTIKRLGTTNASAVRTNATGDAWVPVNFTATGTAQLTVWKSRYFMKLADIPIVNTDFDPEIAAVNWSAGTDNLPNPGETASFTLDVRNLGTQTTTPSLTVTSLDERVTVVTGNGTVNPIAPGATGTSTAFTITLGGELFDGERPRLNVQISDAWDPVNREMQVPVAAPDPVVVSLTIYDGNNGILEADEEADIEVTVRNVGGQAAGDLSAVPSSFDDAIAVDGSVQWDAVPIGGEATSTRFQAHLAEGAAPGRQIVLRFEFYHAGLVIAHKQYILPTGVVSITTPTGPDGYGYYAYEDIDAGYAATPTYSWVELDPASGGSGAAHEVHDDTHFEMALPQPFTYYGQSFDSVWICSNGWFSFENTTLPEFRNWELPSPMGAPSLVAPFWDDLLIDITEPNDDSLHYVWTQFFDGAPDRFVIQWHSLLSEGMAEGSDNDKLCKFEAILEYGDAGDGSIVFQYNQIVNYDRTGEGCYATVGLEDSYHERGLNLTYASFYPATVDTLRPGRAIRITTAPPDFFSAADDLPRAGLPERFALHEAFPNPFNPATQLRFDLPESGDALLQVFDVLGREVATLASGHYAAGRYEVSFDARDLPSGLYFARLQSRSNVMVRKLMLLK